MTEPTITCPKCKTEIKLNESLAAPLIEATRREFEQVLATKDAEVSKHEKAIRLREEAVAKEKVNIDDRIASEVEAQRSKIAIDEAKKAKRVMANEIGQKTKEIGELQEVLEEREKKLAEAQKAQASLVRKQRELDDAKRELELTVETRVQAEVKTTRAKARKEVEDEMKLKVMEKEQTISSMQKQIEELKRRAEQGSQQLQGEVQELDLEALLSSNFAQDIIKRVPKGEHGGDVLHTVSNAVGHPSGTILWETKRTKSWSDGWLTKLRNDQRVAKAEISVIVSKVLPSGVEAFELIDEVWVAHPRIAIPLAISLRQTLLEVASARMSSEGQQTKMEMVYDYLTSPRFRHRVQAIVEAFSTMKEDLDREKKAITKQWAKRDIQIDRVMQATVGMYGDLQGIAGKTLQEIEGLDFKQLAAGDNLAEDE